MVAYSRDWPDLGGLGRAGGRGSGEGERISRHAGERLRGWRAGGVGGGARQGTVRSSRASICTREQGTAGSAGEAVGEAVPACGDRR